MFLYLMFYMKKDIVIKEDVRTKMLMNILVFVALFNTKEQFLPVGSKNKGPEVILNATENSSMSNEGLCSVLFFMVMNTQTNSNMNHTNNLI